MSLAGKLEIGVAATEEPRELFLETRIDPVEGFLEAALGLAIDAADGILERRERVGQVRMLPVEVLLALGLFPELVDRGQVDLAEPLDLLAGLAESHFPVRTVASAVSPAVVTAELEPRCRKLLEQRLATHPQLLHREPHAVEQLARLADPPLGRDHTLLVELPQPRIDRFHRASRGAQILLDAHPPPEAPPRARVRSAASDCSPAPQLRLQVHAARLVLRDLSVEPGQACEQRLVAGSS